MYQNKQQYRYIKNIEELHLNNIENSIKYLTVNKDKLELIEDKCNAIRIINDCKTLLKIYGYKLSNITPNKDI